MNVLEAKTTLSALLAAVESGEEVIISRAGTPVARLVAVEENRPRAVGLDNGRIRIADDFDAYVPPEFEV